MDIKELHRIGCEYSVDQILKHGSLLTSFFLVPWVDDKDKDSKKEMSLIATPWQHWSEKPAYIAGIRAMLAEFNIDYYTFVTEAWMAVVDVRTQPELMDVAPRDRSQREDILFVNSRHRNGECHTTKYTVEYDANGKVTLSPPEQLDFEMTGLMGNLYDDEEPVMATGA